MSAPANGVQADMPARSARRDWRRAALVALPLALALIALIVTQLPGRGVDAERLATDLARASDPAFAALKPAGKPAADQEQPGAARAPDANDQILDAARVLLRARNPDKAIELLNRNRESLRERPEAFLLLGRALEGKRDHATARDFYLAALDRDPMLADAYWGVATTSENLGDLPFALGAMRSYLHTEPDLDPQRLRINQARAAIWEWEAKLGRGEWGPTKGIPPGFSAAELKRDGRGVGVKMQLPETMQPDGTTKYEIKHADKIKIYPRP
jgi:tetratricopeptide (TPR) repeat protein